MNTNELRIGNWVSEKVLGCRQVVTVDPLYFGINTGQGIYSIEHNNLEPIPLTEEWLLRFGFEKNDNNQFILMEGSVDILFNKDLNGWTCDGINFSINMTEHVHQLQNLYFALTGEELKLKENESKTD